MIIKNEFQNIFGSNPLGEGRWRGLVSGGTVERIFSNLNAPGGRWMGMSGFFWSNPGGVGTKETRRVRL